MAYKRETWEIIPGGINLLPGVDRVKEGESLDLCGFRPEALGQLRQAYGWHPITASTVGHNIDSIMMTAGRLYFGGNGGLYRDVYTPVLETGFDGSPLGLIGAGGWAYIMNASKQRKDNGTNIYAWTPQTPSGGSAVAAAGGSLVDGIDEYYVTYTTAALHESNPTGPFFVTHGSGNNSTTVTRPAASDAQVTGWHVYRKSSLLSLIYRVTSSPVAIATATYSDTGGAGQSDNDLQGRGIVLEQDHDAAPAAKVLAMDLHYGRILAANSTAFPGRVWYTPSGRHWFFPALNFIDIGDQGEAILAITVRTGLTLVYKASSIWRIVGDIDNGQIEPVAVEYGIVGRRAVAPTSKADYAISREGVIVCNGDWARKVNTKLDTLFRESAGVEIADGITQQGVNDSQRDECAAGFAQGKLYVSFATPGQPHPNNTYVLDVETDRYARLPGGFSCYYDEGQSGAMLVGNADGYVHSLDPLGVYTQNANPAFVIYHSRYEDQGLPDREKGYGDLVIRHNTQGATLTVGIHLNKGTATADNIAIGSITSSAETESIFPLVYPVGHPREGEEVEGYNIAVRIEGETDSGAGHPVIISSPFRIHYRVLPRKARTFESDVMDLGDIHEIDMLELVMDSEDDVSVEISTAVIGAEMAAGVPFTVPAMSSRKPIHAPFAGAYAAKLFRVRLESDEPFRVHGIRYRSRAIGEYVHGPSGEVWSMMATSPGV